MLNERLKQEQAARERESHELQGESDHDRGPRGVFGVTTARCTHWQRRRRQSTGQWPLSNGRCAVVGPQAETTRTTTFDSRTSCFMPGLFDLKSHDAVRAVASIGHGVCGVCHTPQFDEASLTLFLERLLDKANWHSELSSATLPYDSHSNVLVSAASTCSSGAHASQAGSSPGTTPNAFAAVTVEPPRPQRRRDGVHQGHRIGSRGGTPSPRGIGGSDGARMTRRTRALPYRCATTSGSLLQLFLLVVAPVTQVMLVARDDALLQSTLSSLSDRFGHER